MLTPAEISGKEFEKALFNGYHMGGVDDFLEVVTADYTALYKENGILKSKLKVLVEKIEEYRGTEDAMRMALLTAQKTGEELLAKKTRESEEIAEKMAREAMSRRREIDNLIADENARLKVAADQTSKYVETSMMLLQQHMEFLSKLDNIERAPEPEPEPPTREDIIQSAAREIDTAVEKLFSGVSEEANAIADEAEPTKTFSRAGSELSEDIEPEDDEKPKSRFDDLQFGQNYNYNFDKSE